MSDQYGESHALTEQCAALESYLDTVLAGLLGSDPKDELRFRQVADRLLQTARYKIASFGVRLNSRTPIIKRLPREMLLDVFRNAGPTNRVSISQTCASWRKLLLKTPSLWTTVVWRSGEVQQPMLAPSLELSRSEPHEFDLELQVNESNVYDICGSLHRHIARCRSLKITTTFRFKLFGVMYGEADNDYIDLPESGIVDRSASIQHLVYCLAFTPAPRLREFVLLDDASCIYPSMTSRIHEWSGRMSLFNDESPLLSKLTFSGDIMAFSYCDGLEQLTCIRAWNPEQCDFATWFPNLTHIAIRETSNLANLELPPNIFSLTIAEIGLHQATEAEVAELKRHLIRLAQHVQRLELHLYEFPSWIKDKIDTMNLFISLIADASEALVAILSDKDDRLDIAASWDGKIRRAFNLPSKLFILPDNQDAQKLRSCAEELWISSDITKPGTVRFSRACDWPNLTALRVYAAPDSRLEQVYEGFRNCKPSLQELNCPRMEDFGAIFGGGYGDEPPSRPKRANLCHFARQPRAERLKRFFVQGAGISEDETTSDSDNLPIVVVDDAEERSLLKTLELLYDLHRSGDAGWPLPAPRTDRTE
ncbi:hypothetical protein BKA62DRAFT_755807 [Auriculariales sp. MPI-PUGE-AT-0066]|nr:hypothetical protein BKA62DRAFT_755807 [Auriculariales sp. MPI-PUGE-AT-0066]